MIKMIETLVLNYIKEHPEVLERLIKMLVERLIKELEERAAAA